MYSVLSTAQMYETNFRVFSWHGQSRTFFRLFLYERPKIHKKFWKSLYFYICSQKRTIENFCHRKKVFEELGFFCYRCSQSNVNWRTGFVAKRKFWNSLKDSNTQKQPNFRTSKQKVVRRHLKFHKWHSKSFCWNCKNRAICSIYVE